MAYSSSGTAAGIFRIAPVGNPPGSAGSECIYSLLTVQKWANSLAKQADLRVKQVLLITERKL